MTHNSHHPHHAITTHCKFCRRLFVSEKMAKICADCNINLETYFKMIKEHLEENPGDDAGHISEALGMPLAIITHFIEQDRLVPRDGKCKVCGQPIISGRYCISCNVANLRLKYAGQGAIYVLPEPKKEPPLEAPNLNKVKGPVFHTKQQLKK